MSEIIVYKKGGEITNPKTVRRFFDGMKDGKHLVKHTDLSKRTLKQNDYLHMVFGLVQEGLFEAGYADIKTKEDAKFVCKDLFLFKYIENGTGGKIKVHRSTSELTKEEMSLFIDEIIQWAAEYLSVVIPMPGEATQMFAG